MRARLARWARTIAARRPIATARHARANPMVQRQKSGEDETGARVAEALERLAPPAVSASVPGGNAFVWEPGHGGLVAVAAVAHVPLKLLKGIDAARDTLFENTRRFADGLPANNALLWGARGMGKSSVVKAVHAKVNEGRSDPLALV